MHEWAVRVSRDWPAFEVEERDGWRFGTAEGVTKRANCGLLLDPGAAPGTVTEYYRERGLVPCVQIWPGQEAADTRLAEAGYTVVEPSLVLVREAVERPVGSGTTEITSRPTVAWSALTGGPRAQAEVVERILGQVEAGYGVSPGGIGRGCAVVDGESVAVCSMVTAFEARGRGVGRDVLTDLLCWAYDKGARRAYLCVVADNTPALRLYENFGFTPVSRYHNRVLR